MAHGPRNSVQCVQAVHPNPQLLNYCYTYPAPYTGEGYEEHSALTPWTSWTWPAERAFQASTEQGGVQAIGWTTAISTQATARYFE